MRGPCSKPAPPARFQYLEEKSLQLLAVKPEGSDLVTRRLLDPRQFPLKGLHTDLPGLPPSVLQHWQQQGTGTFGEELTCQEPGEELEGSFLPGEGWQRPCSFAEPAPSRLHIGISIHLAHTLPCPGDSLRPCPSLLEAHSSHIQWFFHTTGHSCLMPHTFLKSLK